MERGAPHFLYPLTMSISTKIHTIARKMYGASSVRFSELAEAQMVQWTNLV